MTITPHIFAAYSKCATKCWLRAVSENPTGNAYAEWIQDQHAQHHILRRYDRKPKRAASRRIFVLQGLPGVGPVLAGRLLHELGSVERVVSADVKTLSQVRGVGPKKAAKIRELVG